jgi:AcrR family transcriptional regulator
MKHDKAPSHPESSRPSPNPARRNEATRQAILDAALELVVANGFAALSVESIAKRAGVGKQTIYRWWPSKGAVLLDAFLENRVEEISGVPVLDPFDTGDFAADVRRVVRDTVRAFASPAWEAPYRAITVAIQDDPDLAARVSERLIQPSLQDVRTWLATAQAHGQIRSDIDLEVAVELLLAPVFHRWLLRTGPLTDDYAEAVAETAIAALATGGQTHSR